MSCLFLLYSPSQKKTKRELPCISSWLSKTRILFLFLSPEKKTNFHDVSLTPMIFISKQTTTKENQSKSFTRLIAASMTLIGRPPAGVSIDHEKNEKEKNASLFSESNIDSDKKRKTNQHALINESTLFKYRRWKPTIATVCRVIFQ